MTGKNKCKILKDIRRQIAENNDIELIIEECTYKGECKGTCPRCEAELRYLEAELLKRKNAGKSVAVAGLAAVMLAASGCANEPIQSNTVSTDSTSLSFSFEEETMGAIPVTYDESSENYNSDYELEGDVAYPSQPPEVQGSITAYTSTSSSDTSTGVRDTGRTMGVPVITDRSSIKVQVSEETAEKERGPALDVNYLLELSPNQRNDFLADYTRVQIIEAWNTSDDFYSFETQSQGDVFLVLHNGKNYELIFYYDSEGFVINHSIKELK